MTHVTQNSNKNYLQIMSSNTHTHTKKKDNFINNQLEYFIFSLALKKKLIKIQPPHTLNAMVTP